MNVPILFDFHDGWNHQYQISYVSLTSYTEMPFAHQFCKNEIIKLVTLIQIIICFLLSYVRGKVLVYGMRC